MSLKQLFSMSVIPLAIGAFASCGGDDSGGGTANIDDIISSLDHPTGSVDSADTAQGVASAYATLQSSSFMGQRRGGDRRDGINCTVDQTNGQTSCTCSGGGSLDITASGSGAGGAAHEVASSCCQSGTGSCCFDGTADILVNSAQGATYTLCYNADYSISGCKTASITISYCTDNMGREWYVVTYMSATYAVSGSYTSGVGGTWTVRDANTEWSCTEDANGDGCCTATGQTSIQLGAGVCS